MIIAFTICSNNYLSQAIILGESLLKHNPNFTFFIGLVDKKHPDIDYNDIPFDIIEVEKICIEGFSEMVLRYNIVELNTSVKPFYFLYFLKKNPKSIIYLDPDIEVFSSFKSLEKELVRNNIVITPHFSTPFFDDKRQHEEDFLNTGLYNLGFLAIGNNNNTKKFIEWWSIRLRTKAYIDFMKGLFTDQIWINFVPIYYDNVSVFKHMGYNTAYWNLHERVISLQNGKYYVNGKTELVFYHYASYKAEKPEVISSGQTRYSFEERNDIVPLFENYTKKLIQKKYHEYRIIPCYYVQLKREFDSNYLRKKIKEIPLYKRAIGKIIRYVIKSLDIKIDYSVLKYKP